MCFCKAQICKCAECCLLFVFFLEQSNLAKVHDFLPNTFNFNNKNLPIFSRNTLTKFKIFQALGGEFQCKNEIELFFQSIHLEGELYQIFIFLDQVNSSKDFSSTQIIRNLLLQKQYLQITSLILYDCNQKFDQNLILKLRNIFNLIFISQIGRELKEIILQRSNQQVQNNLKSQTSLKFSIQQDDNTTKIQINKFLLSLENLKQKDEKKNSIEYVAKLIQLLHNSRQNIFYISQNDQNTYTYTNTAIIKFHHEVLKNLNEFTEDILERIQKIIINNPKRIGKCKQCNSFAYLSQANEILYINKFIPSQCECIQHLQNAIQRKYPILKTCSQKDLEMLIYLLRHQFSIQYMLQKFQQKQIINTQIENNYKQLNEKLQQFEENLKILEKKSQKLKVQKQKILIENESLFQQKEDIQYQIQQLEKKIELCECKQKELDNDHQDDQVSTYYNWQ